MFKPPRDLLNEYLSAKEVIGQLHQCGVRSKAQDSLTWRCLRWVEAHFELLHHFWVYGLALMVSLMVFNSSFGWVNLVVIPVQVVIVGGIITLTELPLMLLLSLLWGIGTTMAERFREPVAEKKP
jgi:hypothetical protein